MANPLWTTGLLRTFFPGRFFLARLTRIPFLRNLMDRWMFRVDRMFVLPKTSAIHIDEILDPPQEVVLPNSVVDGFIERSEYRWIMNACICRESYGCKDYPVGLGCLFMGEAVLGIHPKLGRLATKEEAFEHTRRRPCVSDRKEQTESILAWDRSSGQTFNRLQLLSLLLPAANASGFAHVNIRAVYEIEGREVVRDRCVHGMQSVHPGRVFRQHNPHGRTEGGENRNDPVGLINRLVNVG